ncbi:MAG: substrate-binding domain-containing protein [Succinivibrionaceae bacterium]|nr:substrate-binding domain-containing protein [Succinivibrionaceae bacterium]
MNIKSSCRAALWAASLAPGMALAAPAAPFFFYDQSDDFINAMVARISDESADQGLHVTFNDARSDAGLQSDELHRDQSPSILVVNPVAASNSEESLLLAKELSIPVIFFNRPPEEGMLDQYDKAWYVGVEPRKAGIYQAHLMISYMQDRDGWDRNKNGMLDIVLIKGEHSHVDTVSRTSAFKQAMALTNNELNIIAEAYCDWDRDKAREFFRTTVSSLGLKDVEAVICNNDAMALGVLDMLKERGPLPGYGSNGYIPVIGVDGIDEALEAVAGQRMAGTVMQSPRIYARALVGLALQLLEGGEIDDSALGAVVSDDRFVEIPYEVVDRQRAQEMVKENSRR